MFSPENFFSLKGHLFAPLFAGSEYTWEVLKKLSAFSRDFVQGNVAKVRKGEILVLRTKILYEDEVIEDNFQIDTSHKHPRVIHEGKVLEGASIIYAGAVLMDDDIYVGKNVVIEPGAYITGPAYLGDGTEVRQAAYIRGNVLVGERCVVGHATEVKSSVLLGESKAGHFAYIGDSILGRVNLGAGTKLANLKLTGSPVVITVDGKTYQTGLKKFGAILGDGVETGCNSVTAPGTILGKDVLLYPNGTARGYYPPKTIIKVRQGQQTRNFDFA